MGDTFRLVAYLALAAVLMVVDFRGHWLTRARYAAAVVVQPLYEFAALPSETVDAVRVAFASRHHLTRENQRLRQDLLLAHAQINRMSALVRQNHKLRQLLDTRRSLRMGVQLAHLIDVDLGPYRHRIMLNVGARQGVATGQVVIDAGGVMGQVVEVLPDTCIVMLVTDPDAAVPVVIERTGLRTVAYGSRAGGVLRLPNIPVSADVRVGDELLTSGLGGAYPGGFPVGKIESVAPDAAGMFLTARVQPAAQLNRSRYVLVLRTLAPPIGPPGVAPAVGPPASLAAQGANGAGVGS